MNGGCVCTRCVLGYRGHIARDAVFNSGDAAQSVRGSKGESSAGRHLYWRSIVGGGGACGCISLAVVKRESSGRSAVHVHRLGDGVDGVSVIVGNRVGDALVFAVGD